MTILYITQDGVTDHIGRSEVAPYIMGLARRGHKIHVLSAEKADREELIDRYGVLFQEAGVEWTRQRSARVAHCRSVPPALTTT